MSEPTYDVHPPRARWTHIALRVADIEATIAWYSEFTPMTLLDKREDESGYGAWLGMDDSTDKPFILVLAQFFPHADPFAGAPQAVLAPFAHLGIEVPTRDEVDVMAAKAGEAGCLGMPSTMMPPPIGYICMLKDPDGNMIEYSWDQGIYATVQERWA